jgi:hypothetical protein
MKKALIYIGFSLVMTLAITFGLMRVSIVYEWFASDLVHDFLFMPLHKALDSYGCESHLDIMLGTVLIISFILSLIFIVMCRAMISRLRRTNHH